MSAEKQTYNDHYERLETRFNRRIRKIGGGVLIVAAGIDLAVTAWTGYHPEIGHDRHHIEAIGFDADMTTSEIAEVGASIAKRDKSPEEDIQKNPVPVNPPEEKLRSISGVDSPVPVTYVDIEATHKIDQYFHMNS